MKANTIVGVSTGMLDPNPDFTVFNFKLHEAEDQTFVVQTPVMPKVLAALRQCMAISEEAAALRDGAQDYQSTPQVVTAVTKSGRNSEANMLAVQLATADNIPVDLAMTPEVALKVAKAIMGQLEDVVMVPNKLN